MIPTGSSVEQVGCGSPSLGVSTDGIVALDRPKANREPASRRIQRRLQALENPPKREQEALLRIIDALLAKAS